MLINMLKSKIHRAVVTEANIDYVGSITIDQDLMDAAGLYEYEKVLVADIENANRFETYVISGPRGEGTIGLNGAAAKLVDIGDKVIIMSFGLIDNNCALKHEANIVFVDEKNSIVQIESSEHHGEIR